MRERFGSIRGPDDSRESSDIIIPNMKKPLQDSITPFAQQVYDVVSRIPRGETMTYTQVAVAAGRPRAARAVGNILNKNPFAPRVPCHRVIRSDGSVGGFVDGTDRKKALLRKEGVSL